MNLSRNIKIVCVMLIALWFEVESVETAQKVQNFIFLGGDSDGLTTHCEVLKDETISGVQIIYSWLSLEPLKGQYDFSKIRQNLEYLHSIGKKLFIQIQDRSFLDHKNIPDYVLTEAEYAGGMAPQIDNPGEGKPKTCGWVAKQWNAYVRKRFQALLLALSQEFDGKIYGINLPETAIDLDKTNELAADYDHNKYFESILETMKHMRSVFQKSHVVQYVNFFPDEWNNDQNHMSDLFKCAYENTIGLGGPDVVPNKHTHMKNSYPFFKQYKGKLSCVAMAVQEPTLTYINTKTNRRFTRSEFQDFAVSELGATLIFWCLEAWQKK